MENKELIEAKRALKRLLLLKDRSDLYETEIEMILCLAQDPDMKRLAAERSNDVKSNPNP